MKFARTDRVGEQMQREISRILLEEVKDPRIGMVTISDVRVTQDLRQAKVLFTVYGEGDAREQTLRGLRASAGFIRSRLGQAMRMRHIPELFFSYDDNLSHAMHMSQVLQEVRRRDEALEAEAQAHPPTWGEDSDPNDPQATPSRSQKSSSAPEFDDLEDEDDEDLEDEDDEEDDDDDDEDEDDDDDDEDDGDEDDEDEDDGDDDDDEDDGDDDDADTPVSPSKSSRGALTLRSGRARGPARSR